MPRLMLIDRFAIKMEQAKKDLLKFKSNQIKSKLEIVDINSDADDFRGEGVIFASEYSSTAGRKPLANSNIFS